MIERGGIWYVDCPATVGHEQGGRRPVLVISENAMNQGRSGLVVVAIMTTKPAKYPSHVSAPASVTGCKRDATIMCEHIRTVSVDRMDPKPIGQAGAAVMALVNERVRLILAL